MVAQILACFVHEDIVAELVALRSEFHLIVGAIGHLVYAPGLITFGGGARVGEAGVLQESIPDLDVCAVGGIFVLHVRVQICVAGKNDRFASAVLIYVSGELNVVVGLEGLILITAAGLAVKVVDVNHQSIFEFDRRV